MDTRMLTALLSYWWVLPLLAAVIFWKSVARLLGIVIVPDDSIGLVTKKFVLFGAHRELPPGKIIALKGEAGLQAMDPEKYASVEIARALASSGFKLVPEIVAGSGTDGSSSGLVNVLLANLVRDNLKKST